MKSGRLGSASAGASASKTLNRALALAQTLALANENRRTRATRATLFWLLARRVRVRWCDFAEVAWS